MEVDVRHTVGVLEDRRRDDDRALLRLAGLVPEGGSVAGGRDVADGAGREADQLVADALGQAFSVVDAEDDRLADMEEVRRGDEGRSLRSRGHRIVVGASSRQTEGGKRNERFREILTLHHRRVVEK